MNSRSAVTVFLVALAWGMCLPAFGEEPKLDGEALYLSKCAMCHGANGVAKPMAKGSKNFNDPAFTSSVEEIVKVTMEGKGKMAKLGGKLKPEEAQAIAEHIKTLAPPPPPK